MPHSEQLSTYASTRVPSGPTRAEATAVPDEPALSEASVTVPHVDLDIAKLLTDNAGTMVASLSAIVGAIVGGLIVRGTARSSSRTQRTDEYRREVRSAASSVVRAVRTFIDATKAFERSIFWIKEAVRSTPGHDERYIACKKAKAELNEKLADFELLTDTDALSTVAFMVGVNSTLADCATFNLSFSSQWPNYTETQLEDELKQIRKYTEDLERKTLPKFLERVKERAPHTIVEERRRRKRILRPFTASWRWLIKQHRKNLPPSSPKQKPPAEPDPLPDDNATPAARDHVST